MLICRQICDSCSKYGIGGILRRGKNHQTGCGRSCACRVHPLSSSFFSLTAGIALTVLSFQVLRMSWAVGNGSADLQNADSNDAVPYLTLPRRILPSQ